MRLIGRQSELASCRSVLDFRGTSAGVAITGEPGIGKTTVYRAAVADVEGSGIRVLSTTGRGEAVTVPLAGLADLLDPCVRDVLRQLPPVQADALRVVMRLMPAEVPVDSALLIRATVSAVRALATPRLLVAIDDEQWLDADSKRLMCLTLSWLSQEPIAWLVSVRQDRAHVGLPGALAHELGPRFTRVDLSSLDEGSMRALVLERFPGQWSPRLLRRIVELAAGNAYTALELARETAASGDGLAPTARVPRSLTYALKRRLDRLSSSASAVVRAAALTGRPTRRLLQRALGSAQAAAGVSEALTAGILVACPPDPELHFSHPLLGEVVRAALSPSEQHRWSRVLAEAVDDPNEAAVHWAAAAMEPDERLAAVVAAAAEKALAVGAPARGLALAEAAVALTLDHDGRTAWSRRLLELDCLIASSEFARARMLGHAWVAGGVPENVQGELAARLAWVEGDVPAAIRLLHQAASRLDHLPARAAAVGTELARRIGVLGLRPQHARNIARTAVRHARRAGDPVVLRSALAIDGCLAALMGEPDAGDLLRTATATPGLDRMPFPYQSPETRLAMWHLWRGEVDAARILANRVLGAGRNRGVWESVWGIRLHLVEIEWRAGRWTQANEHATLIDEYARESSFGQAGVAAYALSLVAASRGEVDRARRIAEEGLAATQAQGDLIFAAQCRYVLGHLELSLDDPGAAADWLDPLVPLLAPLGEPGLVAHASDLIEAHARLGRIDEAAHHLDLLQCSAARLDHPWGRIAGARAEAVLHMATGNAQAAVTAGAHSVREASEAGLPLEYGRSLLVWGTAQRKARRRRDAWHTLDEAVTVLTRLGAVRWAALAHAQRDRLVHSSQNILTPSEERVADLVVQGHTNREIASTLMVSVKTVEANLTRIYRKIGVRGRAELITFRCS